MQHQVFFARRGWGVTVKPSVGQSKVPKIVAFHPYADLTCLSISLVFKNVVLLLQKLLLLYNLVNSSLI